MASPTAAMLMTPKYSCHSSYLTLRWIQASLLTWQICMSRHHLKLELDNTELVFLLGNGCLCRDLPITTTHIQFKFLIPVYRAVRGTTPYYLETMVKPYTFDVTLVLTITQRTL